MNRNLTSENNGAFIEVTADGRAKSATSPFEQFKRDRSWMYKTEETLQAGYERLVKCERGILLSAHEFVLEAGEYYESETLGWVYDALAGFVAQKKLGAGEVYRYAHFKWCLKEPEAIVAYQESQDKWRVNNCGTKVTEYESVVRVNSEWGFEASRIKIIGAPYYEATDYQFIRFDCSLRRVVAHMTWLWESENLYQVYA